MNITKNTERKFGDKMKKLSLIFVVITLVFTFSSCSLNNLLKGFINSGSTPGTSDVFNVNSDVVEKPVKKENLIKIGESFSEQYNENDCYRFSYKILDAQIFSSFEKAGVKKEELSSMYDSLKENCENPQFVTVDVEVKCDYKGENPDYFPTMPNFCVGFINSDGIFEDVSGIDCVYFKNHNGKSLESEKDYSKFLIEKGETIKVTVGWIVEKTEKPLLLSYGSFSVGTDGVSDDDRIYIDLGLN